MRYVVLILSLILTSCAPPPFMNYTEEEKLSHSPKTEPSDCLFLVQNHNLCVQGSWTTGPTTKTENQLIIQMKALDPLADFLVPGEFSVDLWMPDMGHGSAPVTITPLDRHSFQVSKVYFLMAGRWQIRMKIGGVVVSTYEVAL